MSTFTMQVTATLILAGKEITAKAGDQLLIVNGVCVGVHTGKKEAAEATATVEHVKVSTYVRKKVKRQPRRPEVEKQREEIDREIYKVMAAHQGTITQRQLRTMMNRELNADDYYLRQSLYRLIREGRIHAEGTSTSRVYRIANNKTTTNSHDTAAITAQQ